MSLWLCHPIRRISHFIMTKLNEEKPPNSPLYFPNQHPRTLPISYLFLPTNSFCPELVNPLQFLWASGTRPLRCILLPSTGPKKRLLSSLLPVMKIIFSLALCLHPSYTFVGASSGAYTSLFRGNELAVEIWRGRAVLVIGAMGISC